MNKKLEDKLRTLPRTAGVYFHKSSSGEVIYVGKAAVLRNRVRQYFQSHRNLDAKTMALVGEITDVDWLETESEIDALFLESEMVKRYKPRYNVLLRDDKSQMFIRISMNETWPTVSFTRNPLDDKAQYYGPFYNGYALKKALRYLRRIFPYYTKEPRKTDSKLEAQIGINPDQHLGNKAYKSDLKKLISYIKGNRVAIVRDIEKAMAEAAKRQDFEAARIYRDQLRVMKELQQKVMFGDREFLDISKDKALNDISQLLGLTGTPKRIEGYDISHMSGSQVVGSMVVFTNGVSDRAQYRKFKVRETNDDYLNMKEMITRRFSVKNLQQWGKPDLIIIDGGKGQLTAAIEALNQKVINVPVVSIAKREEEIIIHAKKSSIDSSHLEAQVSNLSQHISVQRQSDFLVVNLHPMQLNAGGHSRNLRLSYAPSKYDDITKLFQRIRDESHRFAITYHTTLKRKKATASQLDVIPGVGPRTKKKLMKQFGSVKGLNEASYSEIERLIGTAKATIVFKYLTPPTS